MLAKSKIISILLIIIFCVSAITCGILWSVLYTPNTNSFNSSSSLSSNAIIVGELYDNNTNKYSGTNISTFIKMLANSDVGNLDTIKNNIGLGIINANTLRGYTNAGNQANKSIVVTLGGFTWVVTYVSLANGLDANNDGQNDVIATLWLTGDQTLPSSKFGDSNYEYGANSSSGFPTAMYGTSYLRAVINNGGNYIKIASSNKNPTTVAGVYTAVENYEYAAFLAGGVLNDIVVQPKYVSWQESGQDARIYAGETLMLSNENWSKDITDDGFLSSQYNFAHKEYSDAWKEDYLWLPSSSETGYTSTYNGIWGLSGSERSNSKGYAWVRSSDERSTTYINNIAASGSGDNASHVNSSCAVRVAFHLNLSKIASYATIPVTLDKQGGSGGSDKTDALFGEAMPTITIPTRTGYIFGGYYTSTNGGGTQYYNSSGTSVTTFPETGYPTTLYAKWTPSTYTVNLDPQSGSGGTSSVTATYTQAMPTATAPTRAGYGFDGYYTGINGTGTQYYDKDMKSVRNWDIASNTTLYAKWRDCIVTFSTPNNGAEIDSQVTDRNNTMVSYQLIFATNNYISTIQIGTSEVIEIETQLGSISGGDYCTAVRYTAVLTGSEILIEVINLKADITITLGFTNTPQTLKESGASVEGIAVKCTKGGIAYYIADDFENLADTDTITFATKQVLQGYTFSHWEDLDGNNLGSEMSIRLQKSLVMDNVITAVYVQSTNSSVNNETSNT